MKETIEFKKDIIFKTTIQEMTELDVTHEYKVLDDVIEGEFHVSGEYKMTEASVKHEEFLYNIPFAIALSERIKKESVNLVMDDYTYEIDKDILHLKMKLGMHYEEVEIVNETKEEEINSIDEMLDGVEVDEEESVDIDQENSGEKEEVKEQIEEFSKKFNMPDNYITYKIHIMKSDETIDSIAMKYNVRIDDIKEYNKEEVYSIGDKIVIPYFKHEE